MSAYVLGVGKTRFGPSSHPMTRLAHEAILGALSDAGMEITDIGAVLVANFLGGPNESQLHLGSVVMGLFPGMHIPSWRVEAACASGGVAMHQAVTMLGTYDPILVVGVERLSGRPGIEQTRNIGMAGDVLLDSAQGLNFPASYALVAQRHMQRVPASRVAADVARSGARRARSAGTQASCDRGIRGHRPAQHA